MGHLRDVINTLKAEMEYLKGKPPWHRVRKNKINAIIKKYDAEILKEQADRALGKEESKEYKSRLKDMQLRKQNPGKFDVVFINDHTKEQQVLTKQGGITYDLAKYYYEYITYYETEKYNKIGRYEIVVHKPPFLPEEEHFGL